MWSPAYRVWALRAAVTAALAAWIAVSARGPVVGNLMVLVLFGSLYGRTADAWRRRRLPVVEPLEPLGRVEWPTAPVDR
jgi:hypothetical protein